MWCKCKVHGPAIFCKGEVSTSVTCWWGKGHREPVPVVAIYKRESQSLCLGLLLWDRGTDVKGWTQGQGIKCTACGVGRHPGARDQWHGVGEGHRMAYQKMSLGWVGRWMDGILKPPLGLEDLAEVNNQILSTCPEANRSFSPISDCCCSSGHDGAVGGGGRCSPDACSQSPRALSWRVSRGVSAGPK